jgi:hypothetical protein
MLAKLRVVEPRSKPPKRLLPAPQYIRQGVAERDNVIPPTKCAEDIRGKKLPQNSPTGAYGVGYLLRSAHLYVYKIAPGKLSPKRSCSFASILFC